MDDQRLGTAIRTVRERRHWRQVDLAARCGISQPAISRLERGHPGWDPVWISTWLIVADTRTNRRRVQAQGAMLRGALPDQGTAVRRWLSDPVGRVGAGSFWSGSTGSDRAPRGSVRSVRSNR